MVSLTQMQKRVQYSNSNFVPFINLVSVPPKYSPVFEPTGAPQLGEGYDLIHQRSKFKAKIFCRWAATIGCHSVWAVCAFGHCPVRFDDAGGYSYRPNAGGGLCVHLGIGRSSKNCFTAGRHRVASRNNG